MQEERGPEETGQGERYEDGPRGARPPINDAGLRTTERWHARNSTPTDRAQSLPAQPAEPGAGPLQATLAV